MSEAPVASYRDRDAWLAERQTGLGGSDAAAVLGVDPFKTKHELWLEKTGQILAEDLWQKPDIQRGIVLEPVAAELYAQQTGRQIRRQPLRRHPNFDFILGNVDRQILAVGDVKSTGVLEIKCPRMRVLANIKARGLPDYMTVQLMHYLAVYGYSWGSFALFNAENWDLIHFDLEADRKLIDGLLVAEVDFWTKYVNPRVAPPADEQISVEIPKIEGEVQVRDSEEWRDLAINLQEAKQLKIAAEELEEATQTKIQELMHRDEIHAAEVPRVARFYFKWMNGATKWKDTAEAIAQSANLKAENFIVKGEGYKRFTTYFLNGRD